MIATSFNPRILCYIADLYVEIDATRDLFSRCIDYKTDEVCDPDIIILKENYDMSISEELPYEVEVYMESGAQFYRQILGYSGMLLHSSAVEFEGKAYLFSGPSTVGKSTHTKLWQQILGDRATVFNDDKPALRKTDDTWFAYGTPWCGKDGINKNMKVPLAGICFLKQGTENSIRRLSNAEAVGLVLSQTIYKFKNIDRMDLMLTLVDQLVREIPIYELTNRPEPEAARLSYETMRRGAEEAGL